MTHDRRGFCLNLDLFYLFTFLFFSLSFKYAHDTTHTIVYAPLRPSTFLPNPRLVTLVVDSSTLRVTNTINNSPPTHGSSLSWMTHVAMISFPALSFSPLVSRDSYFFSCLFPLRIKHIHFQHIVEAFGLAFRWALESLYNLRIFSSPF